MSTERETVGEVVPNESGMTFLDLLIILAKHKKMILVVTLGAAISCSIGSFLYPNVYTATAKMLPPQQNQSAAAMLLGQLGTLAGLVGGSAVNIKNPNDLYVGILKSRTIADRIIERFDLRRVYDEETMVETRRELSRNSSISAGKDGLITINVDDEDAQRAASIANAYIEELDKLTQTLAVTEAAQRRLFFERQLQQAKKELGESEVALKQTQEKTGLIMLDSQGKAIIESVANLRGQIAAKEVELRAMRTFATERNADYVRVEQELAALKAELTKLERSQVSEAGNLFVPTGKVPEAGLEYVRRLREVKYNETVFELLAKQFEAAKLDEAKEAGFVQVVDSAVPPDRKSKPFRGVIIFFGTLMGLFVGSFAAFMLHIKERAKLDSELAARLALLKRHASFRQE